LSEFFDQTPPCNSDAERGVISRYCLATDPAIITAIEATVSAPSFYHPDHQAIFRAAYALRRSGITADMVTIAEALKRNNLLTEIGGVAYLAELITCCPSDAVAIDYAKLVREDYRRRWVFQSKIDAAKAAFEQGSDPIAIIQNDQARNAEFLRRTMQSAVREGGAAELEHLIAETEAGRRRAVPFLHPILSKISKALMPATITLLCGTPGDGKSFLVLACLMNWIANEIPAAVLMVEGDRAYHLNRLLAIKAGDSRLLDDEILRNRPGWASSLAGEFGESIEQAGRAIYDSGSEDCSLPGVARWIEREAPHNRVLVVDPISLCEAGDKRFIADERFMRETRDTITKYGNSLLLVTHPKTGAGKKGPITLDDLAGGAVYARAAETALLLKKHVEPKSFRVLDRMGIEQDVRANREVRILKGRNGSGGGQSIAYDFAGARLAFSELGIIQQELSTEGADAL